ncbi:MAG TPA: Ig-like domain-containing protein, partial [Caulobacteraceae bacterium]
YGVLWTPSTITWYVDGTAVQSVATPPGMDKPMYMVANMAVGGSWPGNPNASTQFPSALQIDYIHAYTLAQIQSATPTTVQNTAFAASAGHILSVDAAHGVLTGDKDPNGLALSASLAANGGPAHGTLVLNANGSFTYTPNAGFAGTDSFTYIAGDGATNSAPTKVTLNVAAPVMVGGTGNDVYYVDNSAEQITVAAGVTNETVIASVSYALPDNIQNLTVNGSGLTATANAMNDTLTSTGGANTLVGGAGNDTFDVNNVADKVVVGAVHGNDLIVSSVSYALPDNVHVLQLTGTGTTGTANAAGGNYLSSVGGGDILVGSAKGNDTFTVAHSTDVVVVAAGAVNDTVDTYVSFLLPANVQNLVGKGSSAITLAGNGLANVITANSGADMLTGGGGADTFVMAPGQKAETITDFNASDRIDITAYLAKSLNPTFQDFGTYSTVSFSTGETIKLLGVHASDLSLSGHYIV